MEFDIALESNLSLLLDILRNYGPEDLTISQEAFLNVFADALENCNKYGTTLHINF